MGWDIPIVPRPPMRKSPKRLKGTESVVMLGEMSRMTITSAGLLGMSFDVMARTWFLRQRGFGVCLIA